MKNCPKCNCQVSDSAKFCKRCGCKIEEQKQQTIFCENCGSPVEQGATFCAECGSKVGEFCISLDDIECDCREQAKIFLDVDFLDDAFIEEIKEYDYQGAIDDFAKNPTGSAYEFLKNAVELTSANCNLAQAQEKVLSYALDKGFVADVYEYLCGNKCVFSATERADWFIRCAYAKPEYAPALARAGQELISGRHCEKNVRRGLSFLYGAAEQDPTNFLHIFVYESYQNESKEPYYFYHDLIKEVHAGNHNAKTCMENIYFDESRKYREKQKELSEIAENEKDQDKKQILEQFAECCEKMKLTLLHCAKAISEYNPEKQRGE